MIWARATQRVEGIIDAATRSRLGTCPRRFVLLANSVGGRIRWRYFSRPRLFLSEQKRHYEAVDQKAKIPYTINQMTGSPALVVCFSPQGQYFIMTDLKRCDIRFGKTLMRAAKSVLQQ